MTAIFKREFKAFFISPIGYVFSATFLAVSGLFFYLFMLQSTSYSLGNYFTNIIVIFTVLIPLLTMRMLSEERKSKTEQLLLTSPVSITDIIMGKFLSALSIFAIVLAASAINFVFLYMYATPNTAVLITLFAGTLLVGATFIAIGMFISSLTENQLIAAVATIGVILFFLIMGLVSGSVQNDIVRYMLQWISIFARFESFADGVFDIPSILYYISVTGVFIFLTVQVYEKRRWG